MAGPSGTPDVCLSPGHPPRDGCLSIPRAKGNPFRQVTLETAYPGVIDEVRAAIVALLPDRPVHVCRHAVDNKVLVQATYQHWTDVFAQRAS